jgi:hypothetical protein
MRLSARTAARIAGLARQQRSDPIKLTIAQPKTHHPDLPEKSGYDHNLPSLNGLVLTHWLQAASAVAYVLVAIAAS